MDQQPDDSPEPMDALYLEGMISTLEALEHFTAQGNGEMGQDLDHMTGSVQGAALYLLKTRGFGRITDALEDWERLPEAYRKAYREAVAELRAMAERGNEAAVCAVDLLQVCGVLARVGELD